MVLQEYEFMMTLFSEDVCYLLSFSIEYPEHESCSLPIDRVDLLVRSVSKVPASERGNLPLALALLE